MNNRVDFHALLPEKRSIYFGMTPLPDEITYSFVVRAALLTGKSNLSKVADDLFASEGIGYYPAAHLHGGFRQLAQHFVGMEGWDVLTLMNSLSFLPLFRALLPENRIAAAINLSSKTGSKGLGMAAGTKLARLLRNRVAVCPDCLAYDKSKHYVGYYHRVHQIAAVTICPEHGRRLLTHCPVCGLGLPAIPDIACEGCGSALRLDAGSAGPNFDGHLRLARFADACFKGTMPLVDADARLAILRKRAIDAIGTRDGSLADNLAAHLNRTFGADHLKSIGLATDSGQSIGWPGLLIDGKAWATQISPQLVLIAALFYSVDDLRDACEQARPKNRQSILPVIPPKRYGTTTEVLAACPV